MVGLLGRVISPSQVLYLHEITQHRQTRTNIHALSGIRTRDPVYGAQGPRGTGSAISTVLYIRTNSVAKLSQGFSASNEFLKL
jgi:hypothetical protein